MIDKQIENLAKYCYDISKALLIITIINPIFSHRMLLLDMIGGIFSTFVFLLLALVLTRRDR